MSTNESIDELRERYLERELKKGTDHNTALAIACRLAGDEIAARGDTFVQTVEVEAGACGSFTFAPGGDDGPSVDELRAKYLEKELKKGTDHNTALARACEKAGRKVRQLFEAKMAASMAPAPAPTRTDDTRELRAALRENEAKIETAKAKLDLMKAEFKQELRTEIRSALGR